MHSTCPRITKPEDLRAPGAIDQLIAFHRQTFGGMRMGPEEDAAAKAAADKAAADAAATAAAEKAAADKKAADEAAAKAEAEKLGYPANTKAEDMAPEQQAAYYRAQARKHEDRNKEWQRTLDGKTAEEIKAEREELEKLRAKDRTDAENAVEDAKKSTKAEVVKEFGTKLVAAEFKAALAAVDEDRREQIIETIDLAKFINDNGDVDTDKVKSTAAVLAPADTGAGSTKEKKDFGAGRRQSGSSTGTGIDNGRSRYQERHAKKGDA